MSVITVLIPADHVEGVRQSLLDARRELDQGWDEEAAQAARLRRERLDEVELLLEQLGDADPPPERQEVTGSRTVIWNVLYGAVCAAAERVADDCNDYWGGGIESAVLRKGISGLAASFDLLDSVGPPPS